MSFVPSHGNDSSPVKGLARKPMGNRGDAMFVAERCLTVCKLDGLHKRLVDYSETGNTHSASVGIEVHKAWQEPCHFEMPIKRQEVLSVSADCCTRRRIDQDELGVRI
jgi:hypothetical protein